jgi:hypothetical protein
MPFQGNGVFARLYNWGQDAANGLDIQADRMDAEMNGFATGLSNCITRDGQGAPTAAITWGNQDLTAVGNLTAATMTISGTATLGATSVVLDGYAANQKIGYRGIPSVAKTAAYVLALTDVGACIDITTGGVTVPANATVAFGVGDTISVFNNSGSNQSILQGAGVTLHLAGSASTGNRTLAQYGWATMRKIATDIWVIAGAGLS